MNDSNSIDDNQYKATDSYPPRWFGFKGRITRSRWWAFNALYAGIFVCVMAVVVFSLLSEGVVWSGAISNAMEKSIIIFGVLLTILLLGINAQRLHDIGNGYSGWWQLALLVTSETLFAVSGALNTEQDMILVIMFGFFGVCVWVGIFGCIPGNPEKNKYGDPPPRKR